VLPFSHDRRTGRIFTAANEQRPKWKNRPKWSQAKVSDGKSGLGWDVAAYDEYNRLQIAESKDRRTATGKSVEEVIRKEYFDRRLEKTKRDAIDVPPPKRLKSMMVVIDSETEDPNNDDNAKMERYRVVGEVTEV
jgi:hypothetical protein